MSTKRTLEERIAEAQEKQRQYREQEKKLKAQASQKARKERTKHLIEIGGTIYSILGRDFIDGDIERLTSFLKGQENRGEYFSKAMNEISESDTQNTDKKDAAI